MGEIKGSRKGCVSADREFVRTAIVGGRPPQGEQIPRHIPRGLEVLIKKAAVDPAFKKLLFEKRAEAAEAIGLKLNATEEAMLAAVPLPQLEGIVAHTKVSPGLRPAFLGYAASAMLAVLGSATLLSDSEVTRTGGTKRAEVSTSKKRANRGLTGKAAKKESGSWPYALTGGAGGHGSGAGMRGDWPRGGCGRLIPGGSGASLGIRADRPAEAGRRPETALAKTGRSSGRNQLRHRVCMGSRVDVPENSSREQPAPYFITFESPASSPRSYRSAASIRDYVEKRLAGIQNAYDAAVEENPSLGGGKITARFTVDPQGRVVDAEIADDTLGHDSLRRSILSRVRSWKFPAAGQADVVVEYPFVFIAEKG